MTAKRFKFNGRTNCIEYDGKSILLDSYGEDIEELLNLFNEYENLIPELTNNEIALYKLKEIYQIKSDEIIKNTDFKTLYGADNQKIRDNHIKTELSDLHDNIKDLEFSIDWIAGRISYLNHYNVSKIVELLNELHEENIELHIQNDFLKDENQHMRDLVNENEQLKKQLMDCEKFRHTVYQEISKEMSKHD